MLYNKRRVQKVDCKKVLHKVGKFWSVVSIALLGAVGGKALATHANANADVNANVDHDDQVNHQIGNRSLDSSSSNLVHSNGTNLTNNSKNQNRNENQSSAGSQGVMDQQILRGADQVHSDIVKSVPLSGESESHVSNLSKPVQTYLRNNEAYSKNASSFKNALSNGNGTDFLTPNTWYRPKMIHQNGQNWVPSGNNDFRPLLMNWWPDARTQYQYLGYMKKQGYLSPAYSINNDSSEDGLLDADENVQDNVEKHIYQTGNTNDIQTLFSNFVNLMPQWNKDSEDPEDDGLQGGYLQFKNNDLTPNSNSKYRGIGLTGADYYRHHSNHNNMEFLLGNDIDNSNPVVQAEDLNNIYYINNVGTLNGKGKNANFDGFREDATGSMDYDVTDILNAYLSDRYGMRNNDNHADAHLNILEDGSNWAQDLNSKNNHRGALTQDENSYNAIAGDLIAAPGKRANLGCLIYNDGSLNQKTGQYDPNTHFQRDNDFAEQQSWEPNFSRINVHDNGAFLNAVKDIAIKNHPNYYQMSANDQFKALVQADATYNQGENSTQKLDIDGNQQYYNMPSAYAWLLTNKDTVPEVYYGDLFDTSKPYMSTPNIYYNAIKTLLQDRKKYVSGGQEMRMYGTDGQVNGKNAYTSDGILTSVRFGKIGQYPIYGPNDWSRSSNNPTTGMAVVIGENPQFHAANDIKVYMGAAHKNQTYRPSLLSTQTGIDINDNNSALHLTTDAKGYLTIPAKYLNGVSNPQVSGSLSVWVPVGAPSDQDARTLTADNTLQDGNVYHSNATLDSHVLYESFSPFMPGPANQQQSLDYVIAHNVPGKSEKTANWLQDLGITDFRFPPHYTPVQNNNSFIDAADQNGYAFEDRYDLGNSRPTKYGDFDDLLAANEALHNASTANEPVHTLADLVLNQVYDLPGSEPVGVDRVGTVTNGKQDPLSNVKNVLYDDKAISGSDEMQAHYGGKYLSQLQSEYPDLFNTKQISTNKKIDPSTHIHQWSAKYENGSNIQGRGMDYILHDDMNNGQPSNDDYYTVGSQNHLPGIFIDGQPADLATNVANFGIVTPSSGSIDQQRAEASAVTSAANANNGKSASPVNDNNNLTNLMNSGIANSMNVPDAITNGIQAASIESDLANSIHSANPGMNASQAMASAEQSASFAMSNADLEMQRSEASSADSKSNSFMSSFNAMPSAGKQSFEDSIATQESLLVDDNSLINVINSSIADHPNSNVASIVSYVTENADKYISGFSNGPQLNSVINSLDLVASASDSVADNSIINSVSAAANSYQNSLTGNTDINSLTSIGFSLIANGRFSDYQALNSLANEAGDILANPSAATVSNFTNHFDNHTFYDLVAKYHLPMVKDLSVINNIYQLLKNNPQATKQIMGDLGSLNRDDTPAKLDDIASVINQTSAMNTLVGGQIASYARSAASSDAIEQSISNDNSYNNSVASQDASLSASISNSISASNSALISSANSARNAENSAASSEDSYMNSLINSYKASQSVKNAENSMSRSASAESAAAAQLSAEVAKQQRSINTLNAIINALKQAGHNSSNNGEIKSVIQALEQAEQTLSDDGKNDTDIVNTVLNTLKHSGNNSSADQNSINALSSAIKASEQAESASLSAMSAEISASEKAENDSIANEENEINASLRALNQALSQSRNDSSAAQNNDLNALRAEISASEQAENASLSAMSAEISASEEAANALTSANNDRMANSVNAAIASENASVSNASGAASLSASVAAALQSNEIASLNNSISYSVESNNASISNSVNSVNASMSASISSAESLTNSREQSLMNSYASSLASANARNRSAASSSASSNGSSSSSSHSNGSSANVVADQMNEISRDNSLIADDDRVVSSNLTDSDVEHDAQVTSSADYDWRLMNQLASGVASDMASPNSSTVDNANKAVVLANSVTGNTYQLLAAAKSSAASASAANQSNHGQSNGQSSSNSMNSHSASGSSSASHSTTPNTPNSVPSSNSKNSSSNSTPSSDPASSGNQSNSTSDPGSDNGPSDSSTSNGDNEDPNSDPSNGSSTASNSSVSDPNVTTGASSNSSSNNSALPKTGEPVQFNWITIALVSLSVILGMMGAAVDKRRHLN